MQTTYVIRSMSTTDMRPGVTPRSYNIYLLPPQKRASAWWTSSLHLAQHFATLTEADDEVKRYPDTLARAEIVQIDAAARGIPAYWERQRDLH